MKANGIQTARGHERDPEDDRDVAEAPDSCAAAIRICRRQATTVRAIARQTKGATEIAAAMNSRSTVGK